MITLDNDTKEILKLLKSNGNAYIVGGLIRDSLLSKKNSDVDFVTDISLSKLMKILEKYNPNILNTKYESIYFKYNNLNYEFARLRQDIGSLDGRNPIQISFINDIKLDSIRRDFTINAIYYDLEKIYDFHNGKRDIENRIIKIIGDPKKRLLDDKIRILRAFKYIAKLDFNLDENLKSTIKELSEDKKLFSKISKDRFIQEFNKIIINKYAYKALKEMFDLNILKFFIPEYDNKNFSKEVFYDMCERYKNFCKKGFNDIELAYAVIFSFSGKKLLDEKAYETDSVEIFESFYNFFNIKQYNYFTIINLIYYHCLILKNPSIIMIKRMLLDMVNNKGVSKYINFLKILYPRKIREIFLLLYTIQKLYITNEPVFLSDLDIMNSDLYNLNLNTNKFKDIKLQAFRQVLEGKISNTKEEIIKRIFLENNIKRTVIIEKCAGAVVYTKEDGVYKFLVITGVNEGNWGFAKGHIEKGEKPFQTAIREVKEETNIDIALKSEKYFKKTIKYVISPNILKEVTIFLAEAKNTDIKIQEKEVGDAKWLTYKKALSQITYSYQRKILRQAMLYIYEK